MKEADSDLDETHYDEELSDTQTSASNIFKRRSRFNINDKVKGNRINNLEENESLSKDRCSTEVERFHFRLVNEKVVNDITLEALYKPHTLTVLAFLCTYLMYKAFSG